MYPKYKASPILSLLVVTYDINNIGIITPYTPIHIKIRDVTIWKFTMELQVFLYITSQ